ncbi:MAG: baseplate J/gp47 family protein [Oscillospiraceae bacterium]
MLDSIDLNDKSYEALLSEALAQIPLYSEEWTNFNSSDPGITLLQNLTAFSALQQEEINTVTPSIRRRLLALLGIRGGENVAATALAQVPRATALSLPAQYPLHAGSLDFETTEEITAQQWSIQAIYLGRDGDYTDITRLLGGKSNAAADVFGTEPEPGAALTCILEGTPGTRLRFWAQVPEGERRVPFAPGDSQPAFATTVWQYYTAEGWREMEARDETHGFLTDGEIALTVGEEPFAFFPETTVYGSAIRCLLRESHYDRPPRLRVLAGNLFPLRQQKTSAKCFACTPQTASVRSGLAALGNLFVYCRETAEGDYYAYGEAMEGGTARGRYYRRTLSPDGVTVDFDGARFGFAPLDEEDSVLLCCCDNEMVYHRDLGAVYGYEEQIIQLDLVRELLPTAFSVLAELPGQGDEPPTYRRIFPNCPLPDELCYEVLAAEGQLLVRHPAYGDSYRLYLADCVRTGGKTGNLRPGTQLEQLGGYDGTTVERVFEVPGGGFGGAGFETEEELRQRFFQEIHGVHTAVTAKDYELLAKAVPGLSIHKVKAVVFPVENRVEFVILPDAREERPTLSPLYRKQIAAFLEPRRMLTTRIDLFSPCYVRFDVTAKLAIKPNHPDAREEIETLLRRSLDYVTGETPFGSWVRFGDVYAALAALPCVAQISVLRLIPENKENLTAVSADYRLSDRALCYAGDIRLELQPYLGRNR